MRGTLVTSVCALALSVSLLATGCVGSGSQGTEGVPAGGTTATEDATGTTTLADGRYTVDFKTDSDMFHVNEAENGKGTLTVVDGTMTVHIVMPSQNITSIFVGTADDAQKDGANVLQPTVETVSYSDGTTEEVNAFDIPVPALDQEFDVAIVGTKGTWYDHTVTVTNPEPMGQ